MIKAKKKFGQNFLNDQSVIKQILNHLKPSAQDKVLEIGCGWGGLSQFLAENYDCDVTAITISKEQFNYATERIKKAKLNKKVKIIYCDYRNIEGKFDKILSIEMFEAVGKDYWNTFFKKVQSEEIEDYKINSIVDDISNREGTYEEEWEVEFLD